MCECLLCSVVYGSFSFYHRSSLFVLNLSCTTEFVRSGVCNTHYTTAVFTTAVRSSFDKSGNSTKL